MRLIIALFLAVSLSACKQHTWEEVNRTHYIPTTREISCEWCSMSDLAPLLYGKTIIQFRCKEHGEIKTKEYIGVLK